MAASKEIKKIELAKKQEKEDFFAMQKAEMEELNAQKEESKEPNENGEIEDDFW